MKQPDRIDLVRTVCGREIRLRPHKRPDLDELYCVRLIEEHATPEFLARYAKDGVILLGVDGGEFDEHARNGGERKADCCATLVAQALGLADDLVVAELLKLVARSDTTKVASKLDVSYLVKLGHDEYKDNPEVVVRFAMRAFEFLEADQRRFLSEAKTEFERCSSSVYVDVPGCRQLTITTVRSDNKQMNAFARSKLGSRADVVIQRNTDGHTQIHCRPSRNKKDFDWNFFVVKFRDLVRLLRITEARDKDVVIGSQRDMLERDGSFDLIPEWYFMEEGPTILNGSLKHRESVPPTALSLEEIELAVIIALDVKTFEGEREEQCQKGVCTSNGKSPCPWVNWRLYRCVAMRQRKASVPRIMHGKVEVSGKKGVLEIK